jgi:hypothetical protein
MENSEDDEYSPEFVDGVISDYMARKKKNTNIPDADNNQVITGITAANYDAAPANNNQGVAGQEVITDGDSAGKQRTLHDQFGHETGITIWQPVGWGSSSFGHVSTNINGTTYSYGPKGMNILSTKEYLDKNKFRDGMEVRLKLKPQRKADLQKCLSKDQGNYSVKNNNCGAPIQRCLKKIGIDTGNQLFPVSLGNRLLELPDFNGANDYPASKPAKGVNAPWAR